MSFSIEKQKNKGSERGLLYLRMGDPRMARRMGRVCPFSIGKQKKLKGPNGPVYPVWAAVQIKKNKVGSPELSRNGACHAWPCRKGVRVHILLKTGK
jgi:hypothetical protein